jgi:hypothetical protein
MQAAAHWVTLRLENDRLRARPTASLLPRFEAGESENGAESFILFRGTE